MRFPEQRVQLLQALGYTEREARFLYLVATHGGYFLRRQFAVFADVARGKADQAFIEKALEKKHVGEEAHTTAQDRRYHLFSRAVYGALGKANSSNRRRGASTRAVTRILGLDLVLAHLEADFLEEEQDKVRFFTEDEGVPIHSLPAKLYHAWNSNKPPCVRYFVDRFPIFVPAPGSGEPLTFTYVDQGVISVAGFETHLRAYKPLLLCLGGPWRVVFASPTDADFERAGALFDATLDGEERLDHGLVEYFRVRHLWETEGRAALAVEDYVTRGEGQKKYAAAHYEELYRRWIEAGTEAFGSCVLTSPGGGVSRGKFVAFLLPS